MSAPDAFPAKLDFVLKTLSMSRGRLAAELGVDKSLVGRWTSGAVSPSAHSLENLTRLVTSKQSGFTMLDWDRDMTGLAKVFGQALAASPTSGTGIGSADSALPLQGLDIARLVTERRAKTYEGFWRTTRPSIAMPGRLFHDYGIIRKGSNGLLRMSVGGSGLLFDGWLLPVEGQLFSILFDTVGQTPVFGIFNGVALHKATRLDGLILAAALNSSRTPSAFPTVMDRLGDLSGDAEADDAHARELQALDTNASDEVIAELGGHLLRDIGPRAVEDGTGDLLLLASWANNISRGLSFGGHLEG